VYTFGVLIFLVLVFFAFVVVLAVWRGKRGITSGFYNRDHGGQMELDMRLPYRRFKELYPNTRMTYQEYKQLQMRTAYRRGVSSDKNKRMVR